ncbi:MAG TPA: hypothetical protein VII01_09110 [Solirubrobacteraceae bacterium]
MGSGKTVTRVLLGAPLLVALALMIPASSPAAPEPKLRPTTGGALHILPTSAQLTAIINPNGRETTYYFQYGTTTAYGSQTPTLPVPNGTTSQKVGQPISGLLPGTTYHFRVLAVSTNGTPVPGRDRSFIAKAIALRVELDKPATVVVGTPLVLSGTLRGLGAAGHGVILQATPYPYLQSFTDIGPPAVSNAAGRFSFRVANIASTTEFRVTTVDPRPLYSQIISVRASVRVLLHARPSAHAGLVRLYGTISPAVTGAKLYIQVHKTVKGPPGSEPTARWVSQFTGTVKKGGRTFSSFSLVVAPRLAGRYRAYVRLKPGVSPVLSGASSTLVLRASPLAKHKSKGKGKVKAKH